MEESVALQDGNHLRIALPVNHFMNNYKIAPALRPLPPLEPGNFRSRTDRDPKHIPSLHRRDRTPHSPTVPFISFCSLSTKRQIVIARGACLSPRLRTGIAGHAVDIVSCMLKLTVRQHLEGRCSEMAFANRRALEPGYIER